MIQSTSMAEYRFVFLLFLLQCALIVEGGWKEAVFGKQGGSHALKQGERSSNPEDSQLHYRIIENTKQPFMQGHIDGTYCYPPNDHIDDTPPVVITMYEAADMTQDNKGGEVFLASGGVGNNQVCIYIKSQWGGTYKYKFKVFGYERDRNGNGQG